MKTFYFKPLAAHLSIVSMGTADFGCDKSIKDPEAFALLDAYIENGGNLIDTAHMYADWEGGERCSSERAIGRWVRARGNREKVYIASKGAHPDLGTMDVPRVNPEAITHDIDEGLLISGLDYFDIYYLHRDDPRRPVGPIMECLHTQIQKGKIRAIGASNWQSSRIAEANAYARANGLQGFTASQIQFSAAEPNRLPEADTTLLSMDKTEHDFYMRENMLVTAFTSQAKGYLSKKAAGLALSEGTRQQYDSAINDRLLVFVKAIAAKHNVSVTTVCLAYIWSQGFPGIPVLGCHHLAHLADSMADCDFVLTGEETALINAAKFRA